MHDPSFLQGLGLQGPEKDARRKTNGFKASDATVFFGRVFASRKLPLCRTGLCQVAGVSGEAIRADADERILADPRHTRSSVVADIHLAVVP